MRVNEFGPLPIGSVADFVNSIPQDLSRPERFRPRHVQFEDIAEACPRYVTVEHVVDTSTGRPMFGVLGDPILLVTVEDRHDRGPKVHTFTNVDPHGGEFQVEAASDGRMLYSMDHPESLRGQCHKYYYGGVDSRRFHDARNVTELAAGRPLSDGKPGGCRLQMTHYQSGWAPLRGGGPGWRGLAICLRQLRSRIDREGGAFVLFVSGHNAEFARGAYMRIGAETDELIALHGGRIETLLSDKLGVVWGGIPFDAPEARVVDGTHATFPIHSGAIAKQQGQALRATSDCELAATLFGENAPLMFALEAPDVRPALRALTTGQQLSLTKELLASQSEMRVVMARARRFGEHSGLLPNNIYKMQLNWLMDKRKNRWGGYEAEVVGEDQTRALERATVTGWWQRRTLLAAFPILDHCLQDERPGPSSAESLWADVGRVIDDFDDLVETGFEMRLLSAGVVTAVQLAGIHAAYASALDRWADGTAGRINRRIADNVRDAYSEVSVSEPVLELAQPALR